MTANRMALGISMIVWAVLAGVAMKRMEWIRPHMDLVLGAYGTHVAAYLLAAQACLYAALFWVARWLGIGDLGRKMDVLRQGLGSDSPHDAELARALARQRAGEGL